MAWSNILTPVFSPLVSVGAGWAILIISLVLSVVITLLYKWLTDQELMKSLKDDIKKFQQEMKEFRDDPSKVLAAQKKAMEVNMKYMMHSMKPTLFTMIPIILIFGWLNANLAYEPINPGQEFEAYAQFAEDAAGQITMKDTEGIEIIGDATQTITNKRAEWTLKAKKEGTYLLRFSYDEKEFPKRVIITTEHKYETPEERVENDELTALGIKHEKLKPLGSFSIFGWQPGWLGMYIILSLIFSMSLRKLLKLH